MRVLYPHRFQPRSFIKSQVDDVCLSCFPSPLSEEEDHRGNDREQGNTPDNTPSNGPGVTCRRTLAALLITALIGRIRCSWRGAGTRRGGSSFWVPPGRFCKGGVEFALFLVQ